MTKDDLQARVYGWMSKDAGEARRLAAALNAEGIEGDTAVAIDLDGTWCVMLASAAGLLAELDTGHIDEAIP